MLHKNFFFYVIVYLQIPKLFQWLLGVGAILSVWLAVVLEYININSSDSFKTLYILPVSAST